MPPFEFSLNRYSLLRRFSIYVVVAKQNSVIKLYVGKTGDNREGCNPIISRCGNHFSYNYIHSQIRNKIQDHEHWDYTYIFDHFDSYSENPEENRLKINKINEMERWLKQEIHLLIQNKKNCSLINPFAGTGYVPQSIREERNAFRTKELRQIIDGILSAVERHLK